MFEFLCQSDHLAVFFKFEHFVYFRIYFSTKLTCINVEFYIGSNDFDTRIGQTSKGDLCNWRKFMRSVMMWLEWTYWDRRLQTELWLHSAMHNPLIDFLPLSHEQCKNEAVEMFLQIDTINLILFRYTNYKLYH